MTKALIYKHFIMVVQLGVKQNEKQITSSNSKFLNSLKKFNTGEIKIEERNEITKKLGFVNVIDAFHEVNGKTIPKKFFI